MPIGKRGVVRIVGRIANAPASPWSSSPKQNACRNPRLGRVLWLLLRISSKTRRSSSRTRWAQPWLFDDGLPAGSEILLNSQTAPALRNSYAITRSI